MSLLTKILAARDAVNYGEQLANSATWKKGAIAITAMTGLITAVLSVIPGLENANPKDVQDIAEGVYAAVALFNVYVHKASTTKI